MSGHKIASVTISQDEYRRLYAMEKGIQYQSDTVHQPQQVVDLEDLRRNISLDLSSRYDSYISMISTIRSDMADLEYKNSTHLFEQQERVLEAFEQRTRTLSTKHAEDQVEMQQFIAKLSNAIDQLEDSQLKYAAGNESYFEEKLSNDAQLEESIRENVIIISELLRIIEDEYPNHLVDTAETISLIDTLDLVNDNFQNGYLETALSTVQTGLINARKLHHRLQMDYFRYITFYSEMIAQFNELSQKFDQHQSFEPIDPDGAFIEQKMSLNQWSKGVYAELVLELNNLGETIRTNQYNLPFQEIETILEHNLPELHTKFSDCLTNARLEVISSQRRFEIANKIILGLIEQGYKPVLGEYEDHSFVNGYVASVENGYSKINIFIDPIQNTHSENEIHLVSLDFNRVTKHELELRAASVMKSIADPILETTPFKEVGNQTKVGKKPPQLKPPSDRERKK